MRTFNFSNEDIAKALNDENSELASRVLVSDFEGPISILDFDIEGRDLPIGSTLLLSKSVRTPSPSDLVNRIQDRNAYNEEAFKEFMAACFCPSSDSETLCEDFFETEILEWDILKKSISECVHKFVKENPRVLSHNPSGSVWVRKEVGFTLAEDGKWKLSSPEEFQKQVAYQAMERMTEKERTAIQFLSSKGKMPNFP